MDASIYDLGKPLRLPYSCKKTAGRPRTLVRVDRDDETDELVRESVLLGLMTKRDEPTSVLDTFATGGQLLLTAFPAAPTRHSARSGRQVFNSSGDPVYVTTNDHELQRAQQLVTQHFKRPAPPILKANDKIVTFQSETPFDCRRCGVVHTGNTNFYVKFNRDCQPCNVTLHCFQAIAHDEVEPPPVLGTLLGMPHSYGFCNDTHGYNR